MIVWVIGTLTVIVLGALWILVPYLEEKNRG